jgi:hypothetical protein
VIYIVGDEIYATESSSLNRKIYVVESLLGTGSFAQTVKCTLNTSCQTFSVKVIKSFSNYTQQAASEKSILEAVYYLYFIYLFLK